MESRDNPYQPPVSEQPASADAAAANRSGSEATRMSRLLAQLIDVALVLAILIPLQWSQGVFANGATGPTTELGMAVWGLVSFVLSIAINGYLMATRAQTVGKSALGIKVVTLDGANAGFWRIVAVRMLPIDALSMAPVLGPYLAVADCLPIFARQRRCLHDYLAETRVVRA